MPSPGLSNDYVERVPAGSSSKYRDMIEGIVLGLLQASSEGDWDLHLHSK